MRRLRNLAAALGVVFLSEAANATGDVTPPQGAPFCIDKDHLQEFLVAMLKQDSDWLKQLLDCALLKGGLRIGIIEELPSESALGHVSKVRVIFHGSSVVGYMLFINPN